MLKKTLESPLDCREIKPVNPKGNQPWIFTGRTDAEGEAQILWPPDAKSWLIGKDPDAGKDWGQEENGATEDEMVGWHHRLNGHEFEQTPGVIDGQEILACWSPWGRSQTQLSDWSELPQVSTQYYYEIERESKLLYIPIHSLFFFSLSLTPSLGLFTSFFFSLSHKIGLKESVCVFMSISLLFLCP